MTEFVAAEPAMVLEGVGKTYRVYARPIDRLLEAFHFAGRRYHTDITALQDVTLTIPKGEVLGIVGHNGAGKSTLLKIVAGLIPPSFGTVQRFGATSALLDLGAGMNNERSGRDNARFLASLEQLDDEHIDARVQSIIEFADIGDMIDRPMKYYSHGMRARVAFAAATSIRPDLLVVDEVLAVGDSQFQRKCYARMESLMSEGTTVLFVSHDNQTIVEFCRRAILLSDGQVLADGEAASVVKQYLRLQDAKTKDISEPDDDLNGEAQSPEPTSRYVDPALAITRYTEVANADIKLREVRLFSEAGVETNVVDCGDTVTLVIRYAVGMSVERAVLPISIKTKKGVEVAGLRYPSDHTTMSLPAGSVTLNVEFICPLLQGEYFLSAGITRLDADNREVLYRADDCFAFRVLPDPATVRWGFANLNASCSVHLDG